MLFVYGFRSSTSSAHTLTSSHSYTTRHPSNPITLLLRAPPFPSSYAHEAFRITGRTSSLTLEVELFRDGYGGFGEETLVVLSVGLRTRN